MKPITLALLLALSFVPAQFAAGLDDAARLLPADATALIGINVASAKNSVLYSRFEQHMDADDPDKLDDFALQTGLDPRTDLDRLTVAMWGPRAEESILIVAQGRARVTPGAQAFVDMVSQAGSHHGIPIYEGRERTDSRPMHFSFLDEATLIAGTPGAVIDGIERHVAGGPSAFDNDTLMGLASIAEADGQLWMVSRQAGDFLSRAPALPGARDPRLLRILSAMEETTFSDLEPRAEASGCSNSRQPLPSGRGSETRHNPLSKQQASPTSSDRLLRGCEINPSWPPKLPWGGSEWREWIKMG